MRRGIGRLRAGGGGSSTDADAAAWASAVTAAGGTYSGAHLTAVSDAIKARKTAGTWTKRLCWGPLAGDQLTASLVQYKSGVWAPATNVNFVAGDYTPTTGLTGNGSTKYLRTGLVPSVSLTLNNTHLAVYNRAPDATGGQIAIGADDGTNFFQTYAPLSNGTFFSDQYNSNVSAGRASGAVAAPYRQLMASRTGAGAHAVYRDGASVASNATAGGALPGFEMYVFASNSSGVANQFTAMPFGSYSIGSGLTAGEVAADAVIEQAYQTALGRNV